MAIYKVSTVGQYAELSHIALFQGYSAVWETERAFAALAGRAETVG
ncbi:hypothetical protein [Ktedonosporobacter rubrisoli]|nr:hypothetical protein [Ktedonosporobacter rubrisoli]